MDIQRISQSSADKLAEVNRGGSLLSRLLRNYERAAAIIVELGKTGEVGLLPDLLRFALEDNSSLRAAAYSALSDLLSAIPLGHLLEVDTWLREALGHWGRWDSAWARMNPRLVSSLVGRNDFGALAFAAMHGNGHVREAALCQLAQRSDGSELPFLLLRLNDWVVPVRELARGFVSARVRNDYASHLLRCLPLILRIVRCERAQHGWLIEVITQLLNRSECATILQEGLRAPDRETRRACLRFAAVGDETSARAALAFALNDSDPTSRLWAAKHLLSSVEPAELQPLHARLQRDSFMPIRREALTTLVIRVPDAADAALTQALLDRHSSMRELARFHLKDKVDAAGFYREAVHSERGIALVAAIRGLGECGVAADAAIVAAFLDSTEIRLRKAAIAAVGRLAAEEMSKPLLAALADDSPGISAEACSALRAIAPGLTQELRCLLRAEPVPFVRKNALRLVFRLGKWEQLPLILAACRDASPNVASAALDAVGKWLVRSKRSYVSPTPNQLAESESELRQSREFLDSRLEKEITALINDWNRA